jgi:hypothetical protein
MSDQDPAGQGEHAVVPPPRAFAQGVGQVYQVVGMVLFVSLMFVCCGSSLLSKDWATRTELTKIGWGSYSAQRALTISLFSGVFFSLALAAAGLGLQAEHRNSPWIGVAVSGAATIFWIIHCIFAATMGSMLFTLVAGVLAAVFVAMLVLGAAALREMRRDPPAAGHEVLPRDYKVPYSHYHEDPPEVRLERELEQRRERLAVQQKELEMLEERLRKRVEEEKKNRDR